MRVLGIAGSTRKGSFNMSAMRAMKNIAPEDVEIEIFDNLGEILPFNQDLENDPPEVIIELKKKIRESDGIIFATPEYNYSVPGVLKNAIDWASRPYGDNAFDGKPAAIIGASISMTGTARAQYHLRQMMVFLNMFPLNRPEVMIPMAQDKFNEEGNITDEHTKEKLNECLLAFIDWIKKLR